jgi:hypothetical protein
MHSKYRFTHVILFVAGFSILHPTLISCNINVVVREIQTTSKKELEPIIEPLLKIFLRFAKIVGTWTAMWIHRKKYVSVIECCLFLRNDIRLLEFCSERWQLSLYEFKQMMHKNLLKTFFYKRSIDIQYSYVSIIVWDLFDMFLSANTSTKGTLVKRP